MEMHYRGQAGRKGEGVGQNFCDQTETMSCPMSNVYQIDRVDRLEMLR